MRRETFCGCDWLPQRWGVELWKGLCATWRQGLSVTNNEDSKDSGAPVEWVGGRWPKCGQNSFLRRCLGETLGLMRVFAEA